MSAVAGALFATTTVSLQQTAVPPLNPGDVPVSTYFPGDGTVTVKCPSEPVWAVATTLPKLGFPCSGKTRAPSCTWTIPISGRSTGAERFTSPPARRNSPRTVLRLEVWEQPENATKVRAAVQIRSARGLIPFKCPPRAELTHTPPLTAERPGPRAEAWIKDDSNRRF